MLHPHRCGGGGRGDDAVPLGAVRQPVRLAPLRSSSASGRRRGRDTVADVVGCHPNEVVFTGCGTESDNMAITGAIARRGGVAICPAVEHHAVLHVVEQLGDHGRVVGVDSFGRVDLDELSVVLDSTPDVSIVSVMAVNNEVGTVTDIAEVARIVRRHAPGAAAAHRCGPVGMLARPA